MCGIAGMVHHEGGLRASRTVLESMAAAIEHRGPDEGGFHLDGPVGLAIRRLRIIDLLTGQQPMTNEDGSVWVVFNGEIYGYASLREELLARGHRFRSQSDTECIVHAYEEFGTECVKHLRGMFAFAIWDSTRHRLMLSRDRLGKKPVVYAEDPHGIHFASEIQALLKVPGISREVDLGALGDYLAYGYVPPPATIYRSIRKLPPGHSLIWEAGRSRLERYWSLEYEPKWQITDAEALLEVERRLTEAVRLRLISDVPVGALLSGGIDSSLVTAMMARSSNARVRTFSIGFEDRSFDELAHARRVAARYDTDHHEFVVRPDAAQVLPILVRHYGEPFADSSAIPTYYVTKLARGQVTVALNGDGGDEAFAGYQRYRAMHYSSRLHALPGGRALSSLAGSLLTAIRGPLPVQVGKAARFLAAAALPERARYARWVSAIPDDLLADMLLPSLAKAVEGQRSHVVTRTFDEGAHLGLTDRALRTDTATYLPGDLLVKMDIASMANSLETRSPLLDHELVEFVARLPVGLKLRHGTEPKHLLRRLARGYVPAQNIDRPKQGFGVPVGAWLRGDLKEMAGDTMLANDSRVAGYVKRESLTHMWEAHQSGRHDRTVPLWTLLMLELWLRDQGTGP